MYSNKKRKINNDVSLTPTQTPGTIASSNHPTIAPPLSSSPLNQKNEVQDQEFNPTPKTQEFLKQHDALFLEIANIEVNPLSPSQKLSTGTQKKINECGFDDYQKMSQALLALCECATGIHPYQNTIFYFLAQLSKYLEQQLTLMDDRKKKKELKTEIHKTLFNSIKILTEKFLKEEDFLLNCFEKMPNYEDRYSGEAEDQCQKIKNIAITKRNWLVIEKLFTYLICENDILRIKKEYRGEADYTVLMMLITESKNLPSHSFILEVITTEAVTTDEIDTNKESAINHVCPKDNHSALSLACQKGNPKLVELLIKNGANVKIVLDRWKLKDLVPADEYREISLLFLKNQPKHNAPSPKTNTEEKELAQSLTNTGNLNAIYREVNNISHISDGKSDIVYYQNLVRQNRENFHKLGQVIQKSDTKTADQIMKEIGIFSMEKSIEFLLSFSQLSFKSDQPTTLPEKQAPENSLVDDVFIYIFKKVSKQNKKNKQNKYNVELRFSIFKLIQNKYDTAFYIIEKLFQHPIKDHYYLFNTDINQEVYTNTEFVLAIQNKDWKTANLLWETQCFDNMKESPVVRKLFERFAQFIEFALSDKLAVLELVAKIIPSQKAHFENHFEIRQLIMSNNLEKYYDFLSEANFTQIYIGDQTRLIAACTKHANFKFKAFLDAVEKTIANMVLDNQDKKMVSEKLTKNILTMMLSHFPLSAAAQRGDLEEIRFFFEEHHALLKTEFSVDLIQKYRSPYPSLNTQKEEIKTTISFHTFVEIILSADYSHIEIAKYCATYLNPICNYPCIHMHGLPADKPKQTNILSFAETRLTLLMTAIAIRNTELIKIFLNLSGWILMQAVQSKPKPPP